MPGRREALILAGVGTAALGLGALLGPTFLQSRSGAAALLATPYPDLEGKTRTLAEWAGKVLLCNFWATWCEPCREEIPMLVNLRTKYVAKGVEFVGISVDR